MNDQNRFNEDLIDADSNGEPGLAYLLCGPICLDTYFFEERIKNKVWNDDDQAAYNFLLNYCSFKKKQAIRLYEERNNEMKSLVHGITGLFVRDYKSFSFKNAN